VAAQRFAGEAREGIHRGYRSPHGAERNAGAAPPAHD
jgi:hypothetical protein